MSKTLLTKEMIDFALLGGAILGGGGGGSREKGRRIAELAVSHCDLYLHDLDDFEDGDHLVCASLVGAPGSPNQYNSPDQFIRTVELMQASFPHKIVGIITNENGGEATVNGWLQAAVSGLALIDAPCNGRAHPTGVMGGLNLHKDPDYITYQTAVGGDPSTGDEVELLLHGSIDHTTRIVRHASAEIGGLIAVCRNPVTVAHAREHCAVGGITHALETGRAYCEGLATSPQAAVQAAADFLGGKIQGRGMVEDYQIRTEGGFDVGSAKVSGMELTFWNEYMTLDVGDTRLATFPDLIMTFDASSGAPLTTAEMAEGLKVLVLSAPRGNLKLSSTMYEVELLRQVEQIVQRNIVGGRGSAQ